jgi:hypothetical protein
MFSRRRAILGLRNRRGIVSRLRLVKLAFLLSREAKCAAGRHLRFRALQARAVFVHSLSRNARVGAGRLARREGTGHPNRRSSERPGLDVDIECAHPGIHAFKDRFVNYLSELAGKTFMEGGGATPFRTSKPNAGEDVGFWKILVTLPITILSPAWRCGGGTRD